MHYFKLSSLAASNKCTTENSHYCDKGVLTAEEIINFLAF